MCTSGKIQRFDGADIWNTFLTLSGPAASSNNLKQRNAIQAWNKTAEFLIIENEIEYKLNLMP